MTPQQTNILENRLYNLVGKALHASREEKARLAEQIDIIAEQYKLLTGHQYDPARAFHFCKQEIQKRKE